MSRQDQYSVSVTLDGRPTGIWDKMSGGEVNSEETKYKPGAMGPEVSLGGSVSIENVTVQRLYDLNRDHSGLVRDLIAGAGRSEIIVIKQPLDKAGTPFGAPLVYRGVLQRVKPPESDSESSDAAILEIEISTEGSIG